MPRPSKLSITPLAQVRRYFSLDQPTLAAYLGVGAGMIGHVEAGRKASSPAMLLPLATLAAHLPSPTAPPDPEDPAAHLAPPDVAPLQARLAQCQHEAAKLRHQLKTIIQQLEVARRWQQALPPLLAQAPNAPARAWLLRRQEQAAADLDGETAARYHLLRLRAKALEAEATALAALLPAGQRG